jgi:hypothetical protein
MDSLPWEPVLGSLAAITKTLQYYLHGVTGGVKKKFTPTQYVNIKQPSFFQIPKYGKKPYFVFG